MFESTQYRKRASVVFPDIWETLLSLYPPRSIADNLSRGVILSSAPPQHKQPRYRDQSPSSTTQLRDEISSLELFPYQQQPQTGHYTGFAFANPRNPYQFRGINVSSPNMRLDDQ
jgi:hypothetical protein